MRGALRSTARTLYWRTRGGIKVAPRKLFGFVGSGLDATQLLRLKRHGVVAIPGFLERGACAELVEEMDRIFTDYRQLLWIDAAGSDHRAYAADRVSDAVARFGANPWLLQLGRSYLGTELELFFTLANRVEYRLGALGSGGGWHRDTPHEHQFKAILYLRDVEPENGPFQYVLGSHRISALLRMTLTGNAEFGQHRFSEEEVASICDSLGREPKAFPSGAGTLLLVDSSGIHRGMPIRCETRYALTNYYFSPGHIATLTARNKFTGYFVDRKGGAEPAAPQSDL